MLARFTGRKFILSVVSAAIYAIGRWLGADASDMINISLSLLSFVFVEGLADIFSRIFSRKSSVEEGVKQTELKNGLNKAIERKWNDENINKTNPV